MDWLISPFPSTIQTGLSKGNSSAMITVILCLVQFTTVLLLVLSPALATAKQVQSPPKKGRTPQKGQQSEYACKPLRFLDFSPAEKSFTCIWPDKAAGGRCKAPISEKTTRPW